MQILYHKYYILRHDNYESVISNKEQRIIGNNYHWPELHFLCTQRLHTSQRRASWREFTSFLHWEHKSALDVIFVIEIKLILVSLDCKYDEGCSVHGIYRMRDNELIKLFFKMLRCQCTQYRRLIDEVSAIKGSVSSRVLLLLHCFVFWRNCCQ